MKAIKSTLNQTLINKDHTKQFDNVANYLRIIMILAYCLQKLFVIIYLDIKQNTNDKFIKEKYGDLIEHFKRLKFLCKGGVNIFARNGTLYFLNAVYGSYAKFTDKDTKTNENLFKFLLNVVYLRDIKNTYMNTLNGQKFEGFGQFASDMMVQMTTNNTNNIILHYKEYISRLINLTFLEKNDPIIRQKLAELYKIRKILRRELFDKENYDSTKKKYYKANKSSKKDKLEKRLKYLLYLNPFIDKSDITKLKKDIEKLNDQIDELNEQLSKFTSKEKKKIRVELGKIKTCLFTGNSHKNMIFSDDEDRNNEYIKWLDKNRKLIVPDKLDHDNINYTAKSKTLECFIKSRNINIMIEKFGVKPYNILPNPTSLVPQHIAVTVKSLLYVFQDKETRKKLVDSTYYDFCDNEFYSEKDFTDRAIVSIYNELIDDKQKTIKKYKVLSVADLAKLVAKLSNVKCNNIDNIRKLVEHDIKNIDDIIKRVINYKPSMTSIAHHGTSYGKYLFSQIFDFYKIKSGKAIFNEIIYTDGKAISVIFEDKKKKNKNKFDPQIMDEYMNCEELDESDRNYLLDRERYVYAGLDPGKNKPVCMAGDKIILDEKLLLIDKRIKETQLYIKHVREIILACKNWDKDRYKERIVSLEQLLNIFKDHEKDYKDQYIQRRKEYEKEITIEIKDRESQIKELNKIINTHSKSINKLRHQYNEDDATKEKLIEERKQKYTERDNLKDYVKQLEIQINKKSYMRNGDIKHKTYSMTSNRWRHETGMKKASIIRADYTNKNKIVKKCLEDLSLCVHRTFDYGRFTKFIKRFMISFDILNNFYRQKVFRNLKFETYIGKQKMKVQIIREIRDTYLSGNDKNKQLVIFYGMWGGNNKMKGFYSTPNKWIKRILAEHFIILDIDEYNTSKKYYKTGEELNKWTNPKTKKEIHTVLIHKYIDSNEKTKDVFINRDDNGSVNIFRCGMSILRGLGRLNHLKRSINAV